MKDSYGYRLGLQCAVIFFMCSIMWKQRHLDHYWSTPANDRLITFLYVAAAFCVPEVLALVLFVVPWLRNFLENSSWRIFPVLTWWFQVNLSCFE